MTRLSDLIEKFRRSSKAPSAPSFDDGEALTVQAKVIAVFPEVSQARALDQEGMEYALTRKTPGINVKDLHEGQQLSCRVEPDLRRVLYAEPIA